jgi:hypothetical protein
VRKQTFHFTKGHAVLHDLLCRSSVVHVEECAHPKEGEHRQSDAECADRGGGSVRRQREEEEEEEEEEAE